MAVLILSVGAAYFFLLLLFLFSYGFGLCGVFFLVCCCCFFLLFLDIRVAQGWANHRQYHSNVEENDYSTIVVVLPLCSVFQTLFVGVSIVHILHDVALDYSTV